MGGGESLTGLSEQEPCVKDMVYLGAVASFITCNGSQAGLGAWWDFVAQFPLWGQCSCCSVYSKQSGAGWLLAEVD